MLVTTITGQAIAVVAGIAGATDELTRTKEKYMKLLFVFQKP